MQENCLRNYLPVFLNETIDLILDKTETHSYSGFTNYIKTNFIQEYRLECHIHDY